MQKIRNALPICLTIASGNGVYRETTSSILDLHNARLKMNYCFLPDPPRFSLLSPYKATNGTDLSNIAEPDVCIAPGLGG
jgi:hypothetical protein